ncbi:MBL fold metallo-hydrolase [Caldivirga sp.]|uniref:MBL fold metallo-hydrolase n=1 Tax=Caldivirga sp. TaxID=2080243 RepID=UPI0025B8D1D8|nr:MBL fold metallo-hydrolase [Caldivirga sp.]
MFEILVPSIPIYTSVGFVGFCNVSLVEVDGKYVVIDPGHFGNREYLLNALSRRGLKVNDINYVVLTHLHYDHAINALIFKNARVILSEKERDYALAYRERDPYIADMLLDF